MALSRLLSRLPGDVAAALPVGPSPRQAWESAQAAEQLLWLALAAGVERRLVVACALSVVQSALASARPSDVRPTRALKIAQAWLGGGASGSEAWAAGFAAMQAAEGATDDRHAAATRAAACVAFACDDLADDAYYAHSGYCARAIEHARACVDPSRAIALVRARVTTELFEASVARASHPVPLAPELEPQDGFYL